MSLELPEPQVAALQEVAARMLDSRKPGTELRVLARDLLNAFVVTATYAGLDQLLAELPADLNESDNAALIARIEAADIDGRGPRNLRPKQLVDAVVATLGLTVVPAPEPQATLGSDVRDAVTKAIAGVLDVALVAETMREAIVADARKRIEDSSFNKIVKELDERGMQLQRQPKVPLDSLQSVSRALAEARIAVISRAVNEAIDRAKAALPEDAAARFEAPVTLKLTPREVAVQRAHETPLAKTPVNIAKLVVTSLAETARIAWREPEVVAHPYSASRTFEIGDVIEHPKFGRGTVLTQLGTKIEIDFPEGKKQLAHVAPKR